MHGQEVPLRPQLKSTPEKAVIEGMVKRFQEKVDAYVAAQASKE